MTTPQNLRVTRAVVFVVRVLTDASNPVYSAEVAAATGLSRPTVAGVLRRLERHNWVTRQTRRVPGGGGHRAYYQLTDSARGRVPLVVPARGSTWWNLNGYGGLIALAALLTVLAGCSTPQSPAGTLLTGPQAELAALTIAPENGSAPYRRADWGDWTQHGRGCDTREVVLADQGQGEVTDAACRPECPAAAPPCWTSPYDGVTAGNAAALQIDHLVPLAEAAHSGAASWTTARRHAYYNDPANLVAVTIHANTSKGDRDPAEWRPAVRGSWCRYAAGWVHVKASYGLAADPAERDALAVMLNTCPTGTP